VAERVQVWEIDDAEGGRSLRIIRRGTGSTVTWRRAQTVLLSAAAGMPRPPTLAVWALMDSCHYRAIPVVPVTLPGHGRSRACSPVQAGPRLLRSTGR
jgi:hypothetical protein